MELLKQISLVMSGIIILLGIVCYIVFDKEFKILNSGYSREILFKLPPEILQYIYYGRIKSNSFYVAFLNLINLDVYQIENKVIKDGKEIQIIKYNFDHKVELTDYQKNIINIIDDFLIGENCEFGLEIKRLAENIKQTRKEEFKKYADDLKKEKDKLFEGESVIPSKIIELGILGINFIMIFIAIVVAKLDSAKSAFQLLCFLISITYIYTMISWAKEGRKYGKIFLIILFFVFFQSIIIQMMKNCGVEFLYFPFILMFILIQYLFIIKKKSKKEKSVFEGIKGLRKYIKEYSLLHDKESLKYIELWGNYFTLAIAFGINKNIDYFENEVEQDF